MAARALALRRVHSLGASVGKIITSTPNLHYNHLTYATAAAAVPSEKHFSRFPVTLIPGDGVGPALVDAVLEVFKQVGIPVDFEEVYISEVNPRGSVTVQEAIDAINKNGVALAGILSTPASNRTGELRSLNMKIRRRLDLFANVVRVRSLPGIQTRHSNLDLVIIREQTEGEYSALEHETTTGVIECLKIVTRDKSRRIAKFAFDYATKMGRRKVTAVHKANIMKLGDGLFLRSCEEIAHLYPKIEFEAMIIDNTCMQLVSTPSQFDVMVMPNLYGNIIDNLAAGLVGGAGVVPGESYSNDCVIFQPGARHSFSEGVGKNIANPTAMLLCACNMLDHMSLTAHSNRLREAIEKVLSDGKVRTKDLGGHATLSEFIMAVISNVKY